MDIPPPQVIVQIQDGDQVACDGFYDLPVQTSAYVALITDGSPVAVQEASKLRFELRRQISSLPAARLETHQLPCGPCPALRADFNCTAMDRSHSRNVLVFVGGGSGAGPVTQPPVVSLHPNTTTLAIVPAGTQVPTLPWASSTINVGKWVSHATELVPRIFAATGLTAPDARVFISYRREEAGALAEQIFDALNHRQFDVFLDRFRIEVGADFHQRILRELAHKQMAVFLESATIADRRWTKYEIAVAKSSRMGVFAVHLPQGQHIRGIDASRRVNVALTNGMLDAPTLTSVLDRIVNEHTLSQLRRRWLMRQNMQRALVTARVHSQSVVDGAILVQPKQNSTKSYLIWLPSRPAELSDFHVAATTAGSGTSVRAIVGPAAHLVGEDRERMRWLAKTAVVRSFDESAMLQVARAIEAELL
jgi:hypothetical protein